MRDFARARLRRFLVGSEQQCDRHVLRQRARGHDRGRHRAFHVGAAKSKEPPVLHPAAPGVAAPAGIWNSVHMAAQREATLCATFGATFGPAMCNQGAFLDAIEIMVVEPLQLEARERCLDPIGDRAVGDEAAAVDHDEIAGKLHDGAGIVCHLILYRASCRRVDRRTVEAGSAPWCHGRRRYLVQIDHVLAELPDYVVYDLLRMRVQRRKRIIFERQSVADGLVHSTDDLPHLVLPSALLKKIAVIECEESRQEK